MSLKNYMEEVVVEIFQEVRGMHTDFCNCEKCNRDVIAYALSKLKGRYAVSPEGEIIARVEQSDRQVRADALLAVMEALETVSKQPRHSGSDLEQKR